MESVSQFQRYEHAYKLLNTEFFQLKDDFNEVKIDLTNLTEENKKLRKDLKESLGKNFNPSDIELNTNSKLRSYVDNNDKDVIENLENQLNLMRKERENSIQMWQNSLQVISQQETELKNLKFQTAPQTMSFEIELKKKQEEFARSEAAYHKELTICKIDLSQREEDLNDAKLKQNELKLEIENLNSLINQKNLDKRNLIQKEYGYDDALISLQNDINDLETRNITFKKDNHYLKDVLQELQHKINDQNKFIDNAERQNTELKHKLDDSINSAKNMNSEYQNIKLIEQKNREDNIRLNNAIEELMEDAALKTKIEIQEIKKVYNANLEKLINECNTLETSHSNKEAQLEKCMRAKKSLENELDKISLEHQRVTNKENSSYEDLHKRFCTLEREKEVALQRLELRENELKKIQSTYENDKEMNSQIIKDFSEKSYTTRRDLDRLSDEHARSLTLIDELKENAKDFEADRNLLQKQLTKSLQLHSNEKKVITEDNSNKVKTLEENHSRSTFELRQLLNLQQRMSNKWKEECHVITNQSEAKFLEMKKNFENLKENNEKLVADMYSLKQRELENEKAMGIYMNKCRILEGRVKDAENQATEATKRIARQIAREKMLNYEKHLLENDLTRNNFNDTFTSGKAYLRDNIVPPINQ